MTTGVIRSGQLDRRIALQRRADALSDIGESIGTWSTLSVRWAEVKPMVGGARTAERSTAAQWVAREQVQFTVRWSDDIADLSPADRIVFPAADAAESPEVVRSIYDIMSVQEQGRRVTMLILAARRAA